MTATALLSELESLDVRLSLLEDGQIKVDAPKGKLTIDLLSRIRKDKAALILELKFEENETPIKWMLREISKDETAWRELETQVDERAAIMEFDGGLSRDKAEQQAETLVLIAWVNELQAIEKKKAA